MGLTDLFRPKYRHSDAAVRADAVRQMGADEAELVARIARDDRAPAVRRIAMDRIEDPAVLADIAAREPDPALRDHARARAAGLWAARALAAERPGSVEDALAGLGRIGDQRALADVAARAADATVREVALGKLTEARALADLARNGNAHPGTRLAALGRIDDVEILRAIAVDEHHKEVALAALERLDDPETLEQLATKSKNKAVRVRARKRLSDQATPAASSAGPDRGAAPQEGAREGASAEDKRRHAERVQLLQRVETLAGGNAWVQAAAEMAEIEKQWAELSAPDQSEHAERFARARARFQARHDAHLRASAEKQARRPPAPEARRARPAQDDRPAASRAPAAAQGRAEPGAPAPDQASEIASESSAARPERETEPSAAPAATEPGAAQPAAAEAPAAPVEDEQARAAREEAARARKERQARDLAAFGQLIQELERLDTATKRKQVERAQQRVEQALKELDLPPGDETRAAHERYQAARQASFVKAQDLREAEDWERWANVPRQEALIARAEALLAEPDDSKLGDHLKELQNEWRDIGPVPQKKSRELWERFKTACDKVYERVKVARARANEEMLANLARKEALCERVEVLAESDDWEKTAEEIKQLQNEWRRIGPVPRKRSDAVWKRFRAACDRFFERRKPHLDEMLAELTQNLEKKEALCVRAEALAESADWKETSLEIRDLQREWRSIGPVPRKDVNTISKRFRAACDRFFERRDQHHEAERDAQARALDGLRAELRALLDGAPAAAETRPEGDAAGEGQPEPAEPASPVERLSRVRHALRDLSLSTAQQEELYGLITQVALGMLAQSPDIFKGTEIDPVTSRQRKQKLCARAEEIAPAPQAELPAPTDQSPEAVAERLRAALAQNAMSSSLAVSTDARNITDTIAELEASWWRLGPVPGPEGEQLEARFRAACERARQSVSK
ncbi:MAG TPA: DUF349 domain-containing protein [Haliangium sp.]|nr:DUF349 domain-containing protein [Haliangium sp.]